MMVGTLLARAAWTRYWQWMRKYHQFEVRGLEHVLGTRSAMIVGHHGKPGARDLIMLQMLLLHEYGEVTHAITNDMVFRIPVLQALASGMSLVSRDREALARVIGRGEKLVVTPGGVEEAWATVAQRYRVKWRRTGYLRLALAHKLPLIPVVATGSSDAFFALYDAYRIWKPLWERAKLPDGTGLYLGVGPLGLWPLTPPFPVRIVQFVGAPIDLQRTFGRVDPRDREAVQTIHERITGQVQDMLDRARAEVRGRTTGPEFEELTWIAQ
jgi:1-acyl-sn-glycerol-3-phosphate acyltransferase